LATIFYSLAGEGRGHATRARTLIEALRAQHTLVVFAPDLAHDLLEPVYRGSEVTIERIPGLKFAYNAKGRVRVVGTLLSNVDYLACMQQRVESMMPMFDKHRPDLVISDFEPILPRAARIRGIPLLSFDHQHLLVVSDLSSLPTLLRHQANLAAPFVRAFYDWQVETVVSSFYRVSLKPNMRNVTQIGTLIRPEVKSVKSQRDGFLLAYMRRHPVPGLFAAFEALGMPVKLYGLGVHPDRGNIQFRAVDEGRFIEDLASCEAVATTAGNQLVGEALYLRKPVLAIPEPNNFEQAVNAHYLQITGTGRSVTRDLKPADLRDFMDDLDALRSRIVPAAVFGNDDALAAIERHIILPSARASRTPRLSAV